MYWSNPIATRVYSMHISSNLNAYITIHMLKESIYPTERKLTEAKAHAIDERAM